jgi:hypothetical protein
MRRIYLMSLGLLSFGGLAKAQVPTWTLVEDLRIGSEDDGPKSFSDIRGVAATANGNIFVLDFKQQVIRLFDAKGNFIKQVSRDGAGPGEIRNANGMAASANDLVWVNDPANGRFSIFKSDGSFYKQVLVPINMYGYTWDGVIDQQGRAIDRISVRPVAVASGAVRSEAMYRFVDENGKADTVEAPKCPAREAPPDPSFLRFTGNGGSMFMSLPFLPQTQVVTTRAGTAWCTAAAEYSLSTGRLGQPMREVVALKVAPLEVTREERQRSLDRIDSLTRRYGKMIGDPSLMPRTKPVIERIHGDPAGRVWVRTTAAPAAAPSFDVFDPSGRAVAHVASGASRRKMNPYLTWITDTHLYSVEMNDDDVPAVVRYRIVR